MLKPLTTEFKILGNGFETLKSIQKAYDNLKNSLKNGEKGLSGKFPKFSEGFNGLVTKIRSGTRRIGNSFATMRARAEDALNRINKRGSILSLTLGKVAALIGGGIAIRNAFNGATELEMTRTAISSMRGEKRAGELMDFGVNFANVTPYQTREVLDAVKKLELRGLDPTKYLESIGDMSAMLGKPLDQAVEAILDAVTGEFERLKEFGITKKMLEEQISVGSFDRKGSLINQKKMFDDLMNYIATGYKGGMVKLSKTTTGLLSTVKGIYGSFTNLLFTGSETGMIADKSPLGVFKNEILQPLAEDMIRWQKDGTFRKWSEEFSTAFIKIYEAAKSTAKVLWEYRNAVKALIVVFGSIKIMGVLLSAIDILTKFWKVITWIWGAFRTIFGLISSIKVVWPAIVAAISNPVGQVVLIIGALVGAFTFLYNVSETFREFAKLVGKCIWEFMIHPINTFINLISGYKKVMEGLFDWISNKAKSLPTNIIGDWSTKMLDSRESHRERVKNIRNKKSDIKLESIDNSTIKSEPVSKSEQIMIPRETRTVQPIININGGDVATVRKVVEDVIFENEIRSGVR